MSKIVYMESVYGFRICFAYLSGALRKDKNAQNENHTRQSLKKNYFFNIAK